MLLLTLYEELRPVLWATWWHGARLEKSRDETGVVAVLRTETEVAAGTERHRDRERLAACTLAQRWTGF